MPTNSWSCQPVATPAVLSKKLAIMSDIEATLSRIQMHKGVLGVVIVNNQGKPLRSTLDDHLTRQYAELLPSLADLARNLVRDLDPQNDLEFLRVRSFKHEIMVAAKDDFVLIVIQDPTAATS